MEVMSATKIRKSNDTIRFRQSIATGAVGRHVRESKKKSKVAKKLIYGRKTTANVIKQDKQKKAIEGDMAALMDVNRKCRGEKIKDEWKNAICNYWKHEASFPTTDTRNNIVCRKIATHEYIQHIRHIMK